MTEEQVSTVIGVPPGDYGTGYIGFPLRTGDDLVEESGVPFEDKDLWARRTPWKAWQKTGIVDKYWSGNNFYIWVTFDENQGAVGWYLFRFDRPGWPGLLDHLRSELGLQSAGGRPAVKRRVP